MSSPALDGETRREPIIVQLNNGQTLASLQAHYPLSEADFMRLQRSDSKVNTFAGWLLSGWVGFLISVSSKIRIKDGSFDNSGISAGEVIMLVVVIVLVIVLLLIGHYTPNAQTEIAKKIRKYFSDYQAGQNQGQP